MLLVEQLVPFPRDWTGRSTREGWDTFRVFISPAAPPPPGPQTPILAVESVVPFPRGWEKRQTKEGWDTFRPFLSGVAPPPPATAVPIVCVELSVPFPRDQSWDARRPDAWTLFRPYWKEVPTVIQQESSLRFWPDDEAVRLGPWGYFRPFWSEPAAPPPPAAQIFSAYVVPPSPWVETKDEARRVDHWKLFRHFWVEPVAPPPQELFGMPRDGGGISKRRYQRKYVITIDGEDFFVESAEEAEALLDAARETAQEVARAVQDKPVTGKPLVKIPRIRVKGEPGPELQDLVSEVAEARNEIRAMFEEALRNLEIAYYLRQADDEETITLLLH